MEITKRLILNKTPKDMPYGSLSCAKNMMIDDTGSFLTNDTGFIEAFICNEGEKIVGVIPCNTEIVIFTYNSTNRTSHIYRKKDNQSEIEVGSSGHRVNWNYTPGAKITGSYTYNYKGELIIAFSEYNDEGTLNIPLKSLNLDEFDSNQEYAIEEEIPIYDSGSYITANGNLVCGVYTFFVRFKVDRNNYTKWFQVSGDINITQTALSKKYVHKYLFPSGSTNILKTPTAGAFNVNTNKISNKSIVVSLGFGSSKFTSLQLGYIIKRDSEIVGRLQGEYAITSNDILKISIPNNRYLEEISVDSFLENPHQFFNVKNVVNYNNRLYIANYKEHPVEDYSTTALQTSINVGTVSNNRTKEQSSLAQARAVQTHSAQTRASSNNNDTIVWTIDLNVMQHEYVDGTGWTQNTNVNLANIVTDGDGYVIDKAAFINQIATILESKEKFSSTALLWGENRLNYYWFLQKPNDKTVSGAICIAKYVNDENYSVPPSWNWNFNIPDYKVKIIAATNETLANIVIEYNGSTWNLLADGPYGMSNGLTTGDGTKSTVLVFWHTSGAIENHHWQYGNCYSVESEPTWHGWNPEQTTYMNHDIHISINNISSTAEQDNNGGDTPDPGDDDTSGGEISNNSSGANNRTLHPYQTYNFFIHYIRKDGSFTLGFPIRTEPVTYSLASGANVIVPKFRAVNPDVTKFVGYFITYEDVESTVDCVYITLNDSANSLLVFTNAQYLYDLDTIRGSQIKIDGTDYVISQDAMSYIDSRLTYNHVELRGQTFSVSNKVAYVLKSITNIYNNKNKTLYRLTKNIYDFTTEIGTKEYLPAFYTNEVIVQYSPHTKGFIIDPTTNFVIGFDGVTSNESGGPALYDIKINVRSMYSNLPISAMKIKQDFEQGAVTLKHYVYSQNDGTNVERTDSYMNCIVSPDKLHDLLELPACYSAKPSKSYTNFNRNNTFIFDKTVYRSDVVSDENLINSFRHFAASNYKNIFENKGKIVNIVGIGLYFIVHTEYSIYVFDRTPKFTAKSQLDIPDVFDIDYQDIMPANEGFGGLYDKEEAILTKNGYIWFDRVNKFIFKYENGKVSILSVDINNFLKALDVTSIRFAEDIINNRLIICIGCVKQVNGAVNPIVNTNITLSYSFNTNSFISLHDYKFTNNYRTCNTSYLFDDDYPTKLFEFSNDVKVEYGDLAMTKDYFFPYYGVRESDSSGVTAKSYVDIIFNKDYFTIKNVEAIRYVLNTIEGKFLPYNITEEQLNRRFSGNELRIYTDETDSGDLNIVVDESKLNALNEFKVPYFDKGCWNLNYFRNKILEAITGNEMKRSLGNNTPITEENKRIARSDNKSLIYGKYIVVRFIFNNDVNVKFDGVEIVTNKY